MNSVGHNIALTRTVQRIPILLYHSVGTSPSAQFRDFCVSESQFSDHLEMISESGYTVVPLSQVVEHIVEGGPLPPRPLVLTIDDGFRDSLDIAYPLLKAKEFPSILYVVAGFLGLKSTWLTDEGAGNIPMVSPEDLRFLSANGMEIGAHTLTHPWLDSLPSEEVRREVQRSRLVLSDIVGESIESFAYPHGYHSHRTVQLVRSAGFHSACAVRNLVSHSSDNPFALSRVTVRSDMSAEMLDNILNSADLAPKREKIRTLAGRQIRRVKYRFPNKQQARVKNAER